MKSGRILWILLLACGIGRSQTNVAANESYDVRQAGAYPFSPPAAAATKDDKPVSLCWATVSLVSGALVGTVLGGIAGALLPHRWSDDAWRNGFRGAFVGICLGPFFTYEMTAGRRPHAQRHWGFHVGGNLTDVNYDNHGGLNGLVAGLSRSYRPYRRLNIDVIGQYSAKRFSLHDRTVAYATPGTSELQRHNISFQVGYLDLHLVPKANFYKKAFRLGIGAGPVMSVQVAERTKFQVLERKKANLEREEFEFIYETDEPGSPSPYPGYGINLELQAKKIMARIAYKNAFNPTHQIYRLVDATRIRTLEFTLAAWIN